MPKPNRKALQTYGDKPVSFQLEENGEYYCIGADVAKYLGLRRNLYQKYPQMYRRSVTNDERKKLVLLYGLKSCVSAACVFLLRATELEDIIKGNDDKYKTASNHSTEPLPPSKRRYQRSMPSATKSSHLDALLPARQINLKRLHDKKVRTLSPCFDNRNSSANMKTAKQQVISMPLRSDEEIEKRRLRDISIWNKNANGAAKRVSREDFIATEMEVKKPEAAENSSQFEATYNQKCRLCLKNYDQFLELFQNDDILPIKIMAFASIKIERGDGLPSVICFPCCQLLDTSYNFKRLVQKSDSTLRETLLTRVKMNQNAVKESLARSVNNDFVMQHESQLLPLPNNNHLVSNDYNNRQDSGAREINEESMSGSNHLHRKRPNDKNRGNEKQAEMDDDFNESEIILRLNRPEISLIDPLGDEVSVSESIQNMESEFEPIEHEVLLLPEEIVLSEGEDNHHEAETDILRYTCYWCEKQFSDIAELMNHVKNNHDSSNNGNRVDIDNHHGRVETSEEVATLNKNIDSPNNEQIVRRKEYKSKCKVCTKQFTCQKSLLSHIKTHPEYKRSGISDNHSVRLEKTKESRRHQNNSLNPKINESDNNDLPPEGLQCIQCGIIFPTKGNLRRHILTHNDLGFNCSICGKEFSLPDELKDHEQSEHKGKILGQTTKIMTQLMREGRQAVLIPIYEIHGGSLDSGKK